MSDAQSGIPSIKALQTELNEAKVKHAEALYFVQLELNTTRKAKEAVEDRMAELYRDMEELQESLPQNIDNSSKIQIEKYERMLRIMNNQIALVRDSSDSIIKSLKDEISDLMDEKVKTELRLMNQLSDLDREKGKLQRKLSSDENTKPKPVGDDRSADSSVNRGDKSKPPQPPRRHKSIVENNDEVAALKNEILRLRLENKELRAQSAEKNCSSDGQDDDDDSTTTDDKAVKETEQLESELEAERAKAKENLQEWTKEKAKLEDRIENLKKYTMSESRFEEIQEHRDLVMISMDQLAMLWDQADESIQSLDRAVMDLKSHHTEEAGQVLSALETTSLVQSQIKVSLMLIELKFRNNLACLENDKLALDGYSQLPVDVRQQIEKMQKEAFESVNKVGEVAYARIEDLKAKAVAESTSIREKHESKVLELKQMLKHQKKLEAELSKLRKEKGTPGKESANPVEMLMSQKALETLQREVLSIVEKVNEKNETIGRLNAVIEEHKVRERSLMEELKRHMKDQADRQLEEQQRIMQQNAQYNETDTEDRSLGSDGSFEEHTIDETYYEQTVYEEETVL